MKTDLTDVFKRAFKASLALELHKFLGSYRGDCLESLEKSLENCGDFKESKESDDLVLWAVDYYDEIINNVEGFVDCLEFSRDTKDCLSDAINYAKYKNGENREV